MGIVGRMAIRLGVTVVACTIAGYAEYRLAGGPPIRKLYKEIKQKNKVKESFGKYANAIPAEYEVR